MGWHLSALAIATGLGLPIAFIDTERGSARKYADLFDFDVLELDSFSVDNFIAAINAAERGGYKGSHHRQPVSMPGQARTASCGHGKIPGQCHTTRCHPHNSSWMRSLGCKMHVIACMRSKAEYVMDEVNGKKVPRKIGLQPVQREGMEYEFDVLGDLDPGSQPDHLQEPRLSTTSSSRAPVRSSLPSSTNGLVVLLRL